MTSRHGRPGSEAGPRRDSLERSSRPGQAGDLDATRWGSILALDRDFGAGRTGLAGGPLEAYIEVSARCNLACRMCPIIVDPRYDPRSGNPPLLRRELFARLEPLIPRWQRAYLFGLGEPFLNRDLVEYARRLAGAGVEVWITTNGTLVRDEHAEALARAGVARVTVSIDGATAETYERIRRRARFEDLRRGIAALGAARRRHGRPRLFLNMVAMAGNLHELPAVVDLCAEVGGDGVHLEALYAFARLEEFAAQEDLGRLAPERIRELVAEARRRATAGGVRFFTRLDELARFAEGVAAVGPAPAPAPAPAAVASDVPEAVGRGMANGSALTVAAIEPEAMPAAAASGPATAATAPAATVESAAIPAAAELALPWPCSEPWTTINVNAAGEVRPCCFNDQVLGDLTKQSLDEVWNGQAYRQLRADHLAGRVPAGCARCVRAGRIKRSAYLSPRPAQGGAAAAAGSAGGRAMLLAPADGELLGGPLVVVGKLPPRGETPAGAPRSRDELPELWMDGALLVCLRDFALLHGDWFAAAIAVPWVTEGAHRLALAPPRPPPAPDGPGGAGAAAGAAPAGEDPTWEHRRLQIGWLGGEAGDAATCASGEIPSAPETLTAVNRLAVALSLDCPDTALGLRLGGQRHPIATWICGAHGERWLGVAVVDVAALAPGSYALELQLRSHPAFRRRLERLPVPAPVAAG
jgi:MoaA/NifB/PqqE/SkfB family radical SAM enzyme